MSGAGPVTIRSDETKRSRTFRVPVTVAGETQDVTITIGVSCQAIDSEEHALAAFSFVREVVQNALEGRVGELR